MYGRWGMRVWSGSKADLDVANRDPKLRRAVVNNDVWIVDGVARDRRLYVRLSRGIDMVRALDETAERMMGTLVVWGGREC